jgi:hypothetical protein
MHPNLTTLHLHNGDMITYPTNRCSVQLIIRILEAMRYSVGVRLYSHNTIDNLINDEMQFAALVGDALLIIRPPPLPAAKPMEEESNSSSSARSLQGNSDGATSKDSDDNSSHLSSTTNYSQVDPDFPTKPTEEESNGSSTGSRSLQGNSDSSTSKNLDDDSSHLSSTTDYSQVDPDFPTGGYK